MMRVKPVGPMVIAMFTMSLVLASGVDAATMPDVIQMKAPYQHKKGIVTFNHKKHVDEYKIACGECHHNDKGKPLTNLKAGDPAKPCFDCHKKPGELKGKEARGLSDKEKLAYHANAIHENCIGCHRKFNKGKPKAKHAPVSCKQCHGAE
jgi:hypothetical protein